MLTYRTGAAGAPSAARFMSEHLLQQTLPPQMAAMAEYYEQGVTPPTPADAAASRYGHLFVREDPPGEEGLDELIKAEVARLAESALNPDGTALAQDELALRALAAFAAAGLIDRDAAMARMGRFGIVEDAARVEARIAEANRDRDYSSATAVSRRDMNPVLARRLGVDTRRGLTQSEVAFLLNGQRADGGEVEGRMRRAATLPLRDVFRLDRRSLPSREQLEHMLAGRTAAGEALPGEEAERAVRRFLTAMGLKTAVLSAEERENILSGRMVDGREIPDQLYQAKLDTSKARIGYIDLTFSAPKSVSIAWAFAPTKAERAIIHQAHKDAIDSVLGIIEPEIGRARKGRDGKGDYEPGSIGWVSFDHYTARPTVDVVRDDADGQSVTELHMLAGTAGRVPGDMQVHTHVAVFNAVETASGRLGGFDLAQLDGRIHEWGALYQAYLADNLRRHGVRIDLDPRTEMARITTIPESVVTHFSKRTLGGTEAAREYAKSQGLDWDSLDPDRKIGLLKAGVQNPRDAKSDDVSDLATWHRMAAVIGYEHRSVLRPDDIRPTLGREERLETAYQAALPLLAKQFHRRAVIDGADARIAAAKGLIEAGVGSPDDVSAITQAFRERGVRQNDEDAALVWGMVLGAQGRERVALTTTLHEREEKMLIANARAAAGDKSAALSPRQIETAIAAFPEIDFGSDHGRGQRVIIEQIGIGGRLEVAIGVAGSGKSTLLKPLVKAWQDDGRVVHGIALAWRQSDDLTDAGIAAQNTRAVEAFLRGLRMERIKLDRNAVVVVDEIGLLGTRQLNDILKAQKKSGFQLVMIGDPKQMQSVEAGPVISLLRLALGESAVPELGSSIRQKDAEERETVLMFRNGQTEAAILRKDANGTLHIVPGGYSEAVAHVAQLWRQRREENRDRADYSISVSAPTNRDAHEISLAIRTLRREIGEVGVDRIIAQATDGAGRTYDLALAEGDRVRLFRRVNASFPDTGTVGNIGRNGSVLEVTAVRDEGLMLRTMAGREGLVAWASVRDEASGRVQLAYGDALTTNTAQGSTVTEHIHAMPAGSHLVSAFGAYTSGSRHREQSFIVTSDGAERAEVIGRRPLGDRRQVTRSDVLDNITRNFARQPEKESSLNLIDRAADLRRGAIRDFQSGMHKLEEGHAQGNPASALAERLRQRRIIAVVEQQLPGLAAYLRQHQELFEQVARLGSGLARRLGASAQQSDEKGNATAVRRNSAQEFWQHMASQGDAARPADTEAPKQSQAHGRGEAR